MLKFFSRFEMRIACLAAVMLLMAQIGAMAHGYSHDVAVGSTHLTGAGSHDSCKDCLAYAPLLSPAGSSAVFPALEPQGLSLATRSTAKSLVPHLVTLAFRSRAPPAIR